MQAQHSPDFLADTVPSNPHTVVETDTSVAFAGGIEEEAGGTAVRVPRVYPVYPGFDLIRDRRHGDAIRRAEGSWVPWETPNLLSVRPRLPVQVVPPQFLCLHDDIVHSLGLGSI